MREFIKNEKVLALVRKAMENKCITYEEINDGLKDDFPVDKIEQLITGMMDQGIEIIRQADIDKNKKIAKEIKTKEAKAKKTKDILMDLRVVILQIRITLRNLFPVLYRN